MTIAFVAYTGVLLISAGLLLALKKTVKNRINIS